MHCLSSPSPTHADIWEASSVQNSMHRDFHKHARCPWASQTNHTHKTGVMREVALCDMEQAGGH